MSNGKIVKINPLIQARTTAYRSDLELHKRAAEGYKKVGQSIDLHGKEDARVCREAGTFWREETTDKFTSMRPKIDAELAAVADEFQSGGIRWCQRDVERLITPCPTHRQVDSVLARLGEDYYHDDIDAMEVECDDIAVRESDGKDVNLQMKNNIEGIIIKWAHQIDEVTYFYTLTHNLTLEIFYFSFVKPNIFLKLFTIL